MWTQWQADAQCGKQCGTMWQADAQTCHAAHTCHATGSRQGPCKSWDRTLGVSTLKLRGKASHQVAKLHWDDRSIWSVCSWPPAPTHCNLSLLLPYQHLRQPDMFTGQALWWHALFCTEPTQALQKHEIITNYPSHDRCCWPGCQHAWLHQARQLPFLWTHIPAPHTHPFANTPTRINAAMKHTEAYGQLYEVVHKPWQNKHTKDHQSRESTQR